MFIFSTKHEQNIPVAPFKTGLAVDRKPLSIQERPYICMYLLVFS